MVTATGVRHPMITNPDGSVLWFPPDAAFNPSSIDANVNLELTQTTQLYSLGTRYDDIFGRQFRYVEFGGTIAQGSMAQAEVPDAAHDDLTLSAAAVAGDTTLVLAAIACGCDDFIANEYSGGFIFAEAVVGGIAYPIKSHLVWDVSGCDTLTVNLWVPVRTAMAAASDITLVKSKYKEVIIHASPQTAECVGVVSGSGAVDGRFGWVQTKGPCKVLTEGTVVIGYEVRPGETTDGSVTAQDYDEAADADQGSVGRVMNVGPTTEWSLIDLTLE